MPMAQRLERATVHAIARRHHTRVASFGARLARAYLRCYGNFDYDPTTNGELRVLATIGRSAPGTIFDVGANVGGWTVVAREHAPGAEIHSFEIVPATAQRLRANVGSLPRVRVNDFGLADSGTTLTISFFPHATELSGIDPLAEHGDAERVEARVERGDAYCREHGVETLDLLKLDVEGAERLALEGFGDMFAEGRIKAVQFEYGLANIKSGFLLRDLHAFFEERGFVVGKIFPEGVDFRSYSIVVDEDFIGPNYLAVHESRPELVAALSGKLG